MEIFHCKTKLYAGSGALSALKEIDSRRLLVVTDPYFEKNGIAAQVAQRVKGAQSSFFGEVAPDPSAELVARGVAQLTKFQPDTVIALGGGSAMDCAKAMVYLAEEPVRFVAVPTTSGSGSEVTDFAIITAGGVKQVLRDPSLQPDIAILDSDLLTELPRTLVADTGFDVLSHALEALVATGSGMMTDTLATESFCRVYSLLERSFSGDKSVRQSIHTAATMAGMAFSSAGLGLCHAMSHSLGGIFHLPHGRLNAMLLPHVVECNVVGAGEKYAALALRAGMGASAKTLGVKNLKNALIRLRQNLQMPATLARAGVAPEKLRQEKKRIVEAVLADPCCSTNPVPVTGAMVEQVLDKVAGHG